MKNYRIICLFLLSLATNSFAQGVKLSSTPGTPHPSAILDMETSSQGMLPPRLSTAERDAISSPASGLVIFNTTTNCLNYRAAGNWLELCGTCSPQPSAANAGPDQLNLPGTTAALAANAPGQGTGGWSIVSGTGGSFANALSPTSSFTGTAGNSYTLRWTITTSCASTQDDVVISFMQPFLCGTSTVADGSGNSYNTVQVGSQCWLKTNLRTTKYRDGTDIPSSYMLQWGVGGAPSCTASNFNSLSCGILYDGNVMQNAVSACPNGWHIPTRAEYEALYSAVSSDSRRLFHPNAGCSSNCSGFDLYICGQNYVQWEGCGSGDQIYLWTRPNTGNNFTSSFITQYNSGSGSVSYNAVQSAWINYNYSIRCIRD